MILWLDFETRSRYGLRTGGVYNYARDPSTEVLCMSYAFDNDEVQTWLPSHPFPERVAQFKGQIRAHNAAFERLIFWHVLDMPFDLTQFYCTATQARANCLPGSLEDLGRALGAIEAIPQSLGLVTTYATPSAWKKSMGLIGKDKGASRQLATDLYPSWAAMFKRVKDDGRAEAALLAKWGEGL